MPHMSTSTRTLSEAERREQILAAARAVFDENGYEPATVSEIVRRASVAQGTISRDTDAQPRVTLPIMVNLSNHRQVYSAYTDTHLRTSGI